MWYAGFLKLRHIGGAGLFSMMAAQSALAAPPTLTAIYNFQGAADGSGPTAALVADKAGNLYGTTFDGGSATCGAPRKPIYCGTVFKLSPPTSGQGEWTKTVLHTFTSFNAPDGVQPLAGLAIDKSGTLYGTASNGANGNVHGNGTVFSLTPRQATGSDWTFTVLHTFSTLALGGDGAGPAARLLVDKRGNLYGTTVYGTHGATIFVLNKPTPGQTTWVEQIIYNFPGEFASGGGTTPGLVMDGASNLYSIYLQDCCARTSIYKLAPPTGNGVSWTYSDLFFFAGQNGVGSVPTGEIRIDAASVIYGTTKDGGPSPYLPGAVYSLTPPTDGQTSWTETTIHTFARNNTGFYPYGGVTADKFGKLYGTTAGDSTGTYPARGATVFALVPPAPGDTVWDWKKLGAFDGTNGSFPMSSLVIAPNGKLYGTTTAGGAYGFGTVFEQTR